MAARSDPFPFDTALDIVECRDFYDVPHAVLVAGAQSYWILDAPFDDTLDDFSLDYAISFAGVDRDGARRLFADVCERRVAAEVVDRVPRWRVEFDTTRRRELRCRSC